MTEHKTLAQEREDIFDRLKELSKMHFPRYRTYRRPDALGWTESPSRNTWSRKH